MLVAGVLERGQISDRRSSAGQSVLLDDSISEFMGEIIHKDLNSTRNFNWVNLILGKIEIFVFPIGKAELLSGRRRGRRGVEECGEEGVDSENEEESEN